MEALNYEGQYTGHDEPSTLFYSNIPGSGNNNLYFLTLPKDPPTLPKQHGTGGTFNFQLRPAFWFGMAMCDSQSAPNPGMPCKPDTNANSSIVPIPPPPITSASTRVPHSWKCNSIHPAGSLGSPALVAMPPSGAPHSTSTVSPKTIRRARFKTQPAPNSPESSTSTLRSLPRMGKPKRQPIPFNRRLPLSRRIQAKTCS